MKPLVVMVTKMEINDIDRIDAETVSSGYFYEFDRETQRVVRVELGNGKLPHPSEVPELRRSSRGARIPENLYPPSRGCRDKYPDILDYAIVNRESKGAGTLDKHEVARFVSDHDLICHMDEWYIFSDRKIYHKIPVDVINELIYTNLKKFPGCPFPSRTVVADIVAMVKYTCTVNQLEEKATRWAPAIAEDERYTGLLIPFENGIYNFSMDELVGYTPYIFLTRKYPTEYDPSLTSHPVEQIYKRIIPDDVTRNFFFEMVGYTIFHPGMSPPAIFLIYGPTQTGKTALQNAVTKLIGTESYSTLDLSQLSSQYGPIDMIDKVVNISGETGTGRRFGISEADGELLKRLSDGQKVTFERKHKTAISHHNTTKLWFVSNSLPDFGDVSSGLHRRLYVIPCRKKQLWEEQIYDKMTTPDALTWLANQALDGYARFLERGKFQTSPEMDAELAFYRRQESLADFLADAFDAESTEDIRDAVDGHFLAEIYDMYKEYTAANGGRPMGKRTLSERMRNEYDLIQETSTTYNNGRRTRMVALCKREGPDE
ncbi:MAG: phage/plasmid primase, P4 family [Candidatus Methanomethylophilaceae archaeon]|nr:phage/plasmid primase, P4 family [Candidatus Methanomethylophilaceae archaeon]